MTGEIVYRGGLGAGLFSCLMSAGVLGMGAIVLVGKDSSVVAAALLFLMGTFLAYIAVRQFRVRLLIADDEVELRGAVRTKAIPRSLVADAEVGWFIRGWALYLVDTSGRKSLVPEGLRMGPARTLDQRREALVADLAGAPHPPAHERGAVPWNTEAHLVGADDVSTTAYEAVNVSVQWSRMVQDRYARRTPPTSLRPDWMPADEDADPPEPAWLMPVNVSPWAMAAGYLGLASILVLPAPFALVTGFIGLWEVERHPGRRGRARAWFGIAMSILAPAALLLIIHLAASNRGW